MTVERLQPLLDHTKDSKCFQSRNMEKTGATRGRKNVFRVCTLVQNQRTEQEQMLVTPR